jgi:glycosyltransferase involved in cell wall biosynthesis
VALRVAIVADVLAGRMGGVARSVLGVTRELAQLDPDRIEVTVLARRHPAGIDDIAFRRSFSPRLPRFPGSVFAFQRPLTIRGFDVVHYIDSRPPFDFALGGALNVVTQHGFSTLTFGRAMAAGRRWIYLNRALLGVARFADLTFTASESERQALLARTKLDPARVVAIHHGVEHDRFAPPRDPRLSREYIRRAFGLEGRYVLYVSNHQRKKNTERLVEAFASLAAELSEVTLVLTGEHTPRFQLVEELIDRYGLRPRIKVLGHVADEALPHLYGCADVFTLPSLHEGFGLPLLEAMACGTPVVTSNVYAMPEVTGGAAELVDPYSVDAIADGLRRVLVDLQYASELRERGLAQAAIFTWRRAAERHLAEYERALT